MRSRKPHLPVGGRIRHFAKEWKRITRDRNILDMVYGMHLELTDIPFQRKLLKTIVFSPEEEQGGQQQIDSLLKKKAIVQVASKHKQTKFSKGFLSNVFLRPKKDGGFRMILNLKQFNKFID